MSARGLKESALWEKDKLHGYQNGFLFFGIMVIYPFTPKGNKNSQKVKLSGYKESALGPHADTKFSEVFPLELDTSQTLFWDEGPTDQILKKKVLPLETA